MPLIPYMAIIAGLILCFSNKFRLGSSLFALSFGLTAGVINSGKKIESDLKDYVNWFYKSADLPFTEYIFLKGNDNLFFIYNYVFYHNVSASPEFYIFFTTVLAYLIIFFAGYRNFSMNTEVRKKLILMCIFLPFPLIFINSAHFFRQFLAGAFVVFAVYGVNRKKIRLSVFLLASFVHSSAIIFIIFMCIPIKKLKFKQMALLCLSIPLLLKALSVLPYLETGYRTIDVIYYRIVMQTGPPLEMSTLAFIGAVVVLFITTWKSGFESPDDELKNHYIGLTALMVIIFYFIPSLVELSLRFAYFIWMFLPIFLATRINISPYPIIMFMLLGLSCFISVFYIMNNQWDYFCGLERLLTFEIGFSSCVY